MFWQQKVCPRIVQTVPGSGSRSAGTLNLLAQSAVGTGHSRVKIALGNFSFWKNSLEEGTSESCELTMLYVLGLVKHSPRLRPNQAMRDWTAATGNKSDFCLADKRQNEMHFINPQNTGLEETSRIIWSNISWHGLDSMVQHPVQALKCATLGNPPIPWGDYSGG